MSGEVRNGQERSNMVWKGQESQPHLWNVCVLVFIPPGNHTIASSIHHSIMSSVHLNCRSAGFRGVDPQNGGYEFTKEGEF